MQVQVKVDLSQVGRFVKTLDKESATVFRSVIRKTVNEVGKDALGRVKREAGTFSSKIGPNTNLKTSFAARSAGVTIQTNLRKVPWARLYERGSKGSGGRYVKHPVYGSQAENARPDVRARYDNKRSWRQHATHPFFYGQVWADKDELRNRLARELSSALGQLGYK